MSAAEDVLNSFTTFATLSATLSVLALGAIGMALFSGFDQRATNVKVALETQGVIGVRTLESWSDNSLRLRLVYRELFFLQALALISLIPIAPVLWHLFIGKPGFGWLPPLVLCAISLQVYRNALDNRLKAVQA